VTGQAMRAARYHGPGDVRIESVPVPVPGPGEVLVRVLRSGICGTDASEYQHGPIMVPLRSPHPGSGHQGPITIGHEFTGTVVEGGPGTEHLTGRRVATGAGVSCGTCRWCRRGRTNLCAAYWTLGLNADGGMAEYALVPAATCVAVPDGCGDDSAGLAQPLAVGLHAARRAGVREGDTVVLVGAGAIGSFTLYGLARAHRPGRVIVLDVDRERLAAAERLAAVETHDVGGQDPVALVRKLTDAIGADVVIEATGADGAAQRALLMAARGGRVLSVGLPRGPQPLELAEATLREVDLSTTVAHVCAEDMPEALDLLTDGALAGLTLDRVIGLDALVPEGLDALVRRRLRGKVLVDPWA
jgi:(R,R)-butanediol dehydrogenase / meso-butanediol dehydrogenase / diacetyl reductase